MAATRRVSLTVAPHYETVLKLGPVGYWPADEGEGDALRDLSPAANHAVLHNVDWQEGLLYFRGLFQWAEIPASEIYLSRTFSLAGWVFLRARVRGGWNDDRDRGAGMTLLGNGYHTSSFSLDTLNKEEVLFQKSTWRVNGGSGEGASIRIRRGERLDILSDGQDDAMGTAEVADQVAIGEWQHVLYTYESPAAIKGDNEWLTLQDATHFDNGGVAKLYVNGQLVASQDRVAYQPRLAPFLIGSDAQWWLQAVTSGALDGSVRDLLIFDRALSEEDVTTLVESTRPEVKPNIFGPTTLLVNERPINADELAALPAEHAWDILQQLDAFKKDELRPYTAWLKTQRDALAVSLLMKLGEREHVRKLVPRYVQIYRNTELSDEQRADALLALARCKELARDAALDELVGELQTLEPAPLRVEDYYRNALIYAVMTLDPEHELLSTVVRRTEGRAFTQGDEARDSRPMVDNQRAYTSSAVHAGSTYRCGNGVAFDGVEPVSAEAFEAIAQEIEEEYPNVRRWAEGKDLARVTIIRTDREGNSEKVYPLGRRFIFDQTDAKLRGWSIAFDKEGYIHLSGGMHNAPVAENFMPGSWESWGMSRDLQSDRYPTLPYWVSTRPGDVTEVEFVGHRDNPRNVPLALGLNYINFVQDREGELYTYGRIQVQGIQSWGLYRYDTASKSWTALGGFAPDVKREFPVWSDRFIRMAADWLALPSIRWRHQHPRSKVLAWSRQPHFYNFIRGWGMRWDADNRLHVQVPMFALDKNDRTTNLELYAYSDDGGETFFGADGSQLALPLTTNPGPGNACIQTPRNLKRWNLWVSLLGETGGSCGLITY